MGALIVEESSEDCTVTTSIGERSQCRQICSLEVYRLHERLPIDGERILQTSGEHKQRGAAESHPFAPVEFDFFGRSDGRPHQRRVSAIRMHLLLECIYSALSRS